MDYERILPYITQGLIKEQRHPECPALAIFNYTPLCQFTSAWDVVTMVCRGLILNTETGEIVARPFTKFFNLSQHTGQRLHIPVELPIVTEKMDGSLGILYWLNGDPCIATRGSFTSGQAIWATKWLRSAMAPMTQEPWDILSNQNVTHLFEIIYQNNRIVVNYDFEGLAYLAVIDKATGKDIWPLPLLPYMRYPKELRLRENDFATIQARDEENAEGYVALWPSSGLRLKAKFSTYVRLHKLLTGLSEKAIWELLSTGTNIAQMLENVPDEWMAWFDAVKNELLVAFQAIWHEVDTDWQHLCMEWRIQGYTKETHRKEMALQMLTCAYPHLLFAMLDGKTFHQQIWRRIKPKGQRTFHENIDHA